jgi:anti-sigma B factor antagonist
MTSGQEFSVEVRQDGAAVVVAPHGELDLGSVDELRAALRRHDLVQCRAIVLDLSGVSFLDSSGLSLVVQEHQCCERDGSDFRLVPGPETVQRVFEMTGLAGRLVWVNPAAETARDGN